MAQVGRPPGLSFRLGASLSPKDILGAVLANAGAGMTGGCLFLRREYEPCVNSDYLAPIPWRQEEEDLFRGLIHSHAAETDSATALALLGDWPGTLEAFAPFLPVALARSLR